MAIIKLINYLNASGQVDVNSENVVEIVTADGQSNRTFAFYPSNIFAPLYTKPSTTYNPYNTVMAYDAAHAGYLFVYKFTNGYYVGASWVYLNEYNGQLKVYYSNNINNLFTDVNIIMNRTGYPEPAQCSYITFTESGNNTIITMRPDPKQSFYSYNTITYTVSNAKLNELSFKRETDHFYRGLYRYDYVDAKAREQISNKQDALTTAQISAVDSGINSDKVSVYDSYATTKQNKLTQGSGITISEDNVISATIQVDRVTNEQIDALFE